MKSAMAWTRSDDLPSRSPKLSDCIGRELTTSRLSLSVAAIAQSPPSTRSRPNFVSSTSRCRMPLSNGTIAVCGPTAGANDLMASSRSNALQLSSNRIEFIGELVGLHRRWVFQRHVAVRAFDHEGRRWRVRPRALGGPEMSHRAGLKPPAAEIPTDGAGADHEHTHTGFLLLFLKKGRIVSGEQRIGKGPFALRYPLFAIPYSRLPTIFRRTGGFQLKGPGTAGLLVELPVGGGDRGRRHQQIGIVERFLAPELLAALAHPGGVDAGNR